MAGLTLTAPQTRALRLRLTGYPWTNEPSTQFGGQVPPRAHALDDIGLTSEQIAFIWSRIRAQEKTMNLDKPIGWPCQPFRNPSRVVASARSTLIYNGFRPNATFKRLNSRQIFFQAIRDGDPYQGTIVKSGPRQIAISALRLPMIGEHGVSSLVRVPVTFNA